MADLLAARLEGAPVQTVEPGISAEENAELTSLLGVAHRLDARMKPLSPSPAFVRSLRHELLGEARRCARRREKRHRIAVISAAIAGAVVSLASLIGGFVVLVKWLRTRTEARNPSTA